jgi:hypothetical protein
MLYLITAILDSWPGCTCSCFQFVRIITKNGGGKGFGLMVSVICGQYFVGMPLRCASSCGRSCHSEGRFSLMFGDDMRAEILNWVVDLWLGEQFDQIWGVLF